MKKYLLIATALVALASCSDDTFVGENSPNTNDTYGGEIVFSSNLQKQTRADEFVGASAAEKLGRMFVVEGTKGTEQTSSPSTTVVFDNYLVGYDYNSAGRTESNTNNWEYVGKQTGITGRLEAATWTALHGTGTAQAQTVKYWDYSTDQYDFIAWSTGLREAVTTAPTSGTSVKVTRINTGSTLASDGFTLTALSAADLKECYYTDINTVLKANYGAPVKLTFRNMAAKVRVALYETVPGYSVKEVKFYSAESDDDTTTDKYDPKDLGTGSSDANAVLFTTGSDVLPQSGAVTVMYPHIGKTHRDGDSNADPAILPAEDYNKASVTVASVDGGATATTQTFGALTANYTGKESDNTYEPAGNIYLGRTLPNATFAGKSADNYYTAVIPNTNGKPLTLRVDYTLVSTDGSKEEINVYGAKAVVPATYTVWQPNYAYTYIFKISDNSNGWTSQTSTDPQGLFPITFDAVVTSFVDANAEQTTVTTVATPSITTYQQGHNHAAKNEYSKSQTAGASSAVKDLYVQVMDNSGATPTLKADLNGTNKSLLFKITKKNASDEDVDYDEASEAEVMDVLQNRTNAYNDVSPIGRNGITLTKDATNLSNTVTEIVNGVDDQPITKIAGTAISAGQVAKIDIDKLATGTYAYVYSTKVPTNDDAVFNVVTDAEATSNYTKYYEVCLTASDGTGNVLSTGVAEENHVYFVKNLDQNDKFISYTFKQTKIGESVVGLVDGGAITIGTKATSHHAAEGKSYFYFDVYNQNDGEYAVKVIKVVD